MESQSVAENANPPIGIGSSRKQKKQRALALYLEGRTYAEIGKQLGFSRQRAQQLTRPRLGVQDFVKRRAAGKCENCTTEISNGHLHHVRLGQTLENFNSPAMLLYLCVACHKKADHFGSVEKTIELLTRPEKVVRTPEEIHAWHVQAGRRGGSATARKYSWEVRREWFSLGGRNGTKARAGRKKELMELNRRGFLSKIIGGIVLGAAARSWPFRVYSFATRPVVAFPAIRLITAYDLRAPRIIARFDILEGWPEFQNPGRIITIVGGPNSNF